MSVVSGHKGTVIVYVETRKEDGTYNNLEIQVGMLFIWSHCNHACSSMACVCMCVYVCIAALLQSFV